MTDNGACAPLPLEGVRVVEMTHMVMGPSCGMFLVQLGAEVIKVEPPEGDKTRLLTGMGAAFFPVFNRGKRSVALDLKTDAGRDALYRLLDTADGFVENFRDGAVERLGLDDATIKERWPRLIRVSCKGFLSGPYAHRPALDEVVQMMSGLAYMTGPKGNPLRVGSSANDIMGGMHGALSFLGALLARERNGSGKSIRVGLFENSLLMVAQHMVQYQLTGIEPPPMPDRDFSWPVYDIFETADGRQVFVGVVTGTQWVQFCEEFDLPELAEDERLVTQVDRINARGWTIPIVAKCLIQFNETELVEKLEQLGLPYSPIKRPVEMYDDPHVKRPGGLVTSRNADGTEFQTPAMPVEYDGLPVVGELDLPSLGFDTEKVLSELGYSDEEIDSLRCVRS